MDKRNLRTIQNLGTWFGLGNCPKMPGTIGTLGGIPVFIILSQMRKIFPNLVIYNSFYFLFLMSFFCLAVYVSDICEREIYKKSDPQNVVIDEVLGFLTTCFLLNPVGLISHIKVIVAGFVMFRLLDITKPGPIYKSQDFPNGIGVVLDDFLAGIFGNFILVVIFSLLRWA